MLSFPCFFSLLSFTEHYLLYAQSVFSHASHPASGHLSLTGLAPMTAVTDLDGLSIQASVIVSPIVFAQSNMRRNGS